MLWHKREFKKWIENDCQLSTKRYSLFAYHVWDKDEKSRMPTFLYLNNTNLSAIPNCISLLTTLMVIFL